MAAQGWLRHVAVDVSPLRTYRELRLLLLGQNISLFGSMVTFVAVPYQIYKITHSSLMVGLSGLLEITAIVLVAFLAGALADAVDRRKMVRISEVMLMATSVGLLINGVVGHPSLVAIYALCFALAGADALQRPSLDSMVPRLVPSEDLPATQAIESVLGTTATLAGPALGGVLIAAAGLGAACGFDVATFLVSLTSLARMTAMPPPPDAERPSLARVKEGLRYARSRQELMGTYLVDMAAMFFGMPLALFPAFTIPDSLRGRLASIELISYSSGPSLAGVESGVAVNLVGTRGSGISGGALCIVSVGLITLALPGFWKYDVRQWRADHPESAQTVEPEPAMTAGRITPDPSTELSE